MMPLKPPQRLRGVQHARAALVVVPVVLFILKDSALSVARTQPKGSYMRLPCGFLAPPGPAGGGGAAIKNACSRIISIGGPSWAQSSCSSVKHRPIKQQQPTLRAMAHSGSDSKSLDHGFKKGKSRDQRQPQKSLDHVIAPKSVGSNESGLRRPESRPTAPATSDRVGQAAHWGALQKPSSSSKGSKEPSKYKRKTQVGSAVIGSLLPLFLGAFAP